MFFNKKKPKLDAKVRFQHKQFTTKLDSARSYKRSSRAVPEAKWEKTLVSIGLSERWSQVAALFLLAGLLYLIYIPNFLSLQDIKISGLSDAQSNELESEIRKQIADAPFYDPQYNLVFLNQKLIARAVGNIPSIDYVATISKNYLNKSLTIDAASKYERFLVSSPLQVYDVYNDGTLKQIAGVSLADWESHQNEKMIKVKLHQKFNYSSNTDLFKQPLFNYISALSDNLSLLEGQKLAYLTFREPEKEVEPELPLQAEPAPVEGEETPAEELPEPPAEPVVIEIPSVELPINSSEVHVVFYKNNDVRRTYRVIFDSTSDPKKNLAELKLLLSQTAPDRYDQLSYIDMRIPDKAFICLESAPCSE